MKQKYIITIILLIVALLVSLLLNYFLFNKGRWYYYQLNWVRLDPLGLKSYSLENNPSKEPSKTRVVFYGDSRAASWSSPEYEDFEFLNRGIGAQTSAQVLQRFDQHIQPLQPDVIIIQVGINDLITIPLFPDQNDEIVSDLQRNIEMIVQKSIDQKSTVILTTIFPLGKIPIERRPFWSDDVGPAIQRVNTFLHSLKSESVILFDSYSILIGKNNLTQSKYSKDFLHLNKIGYKVLNEDLSQVMISLKPR